MTPKTKGTLIDAATYAVAFGIAAVPFMMIDNIFAATAVFTAVATAVIFIVTVVTKDVSVYDPYWSVAPPVMLLADILKYRLWNINSAILLTVTLIWAVRLTANWFVTYKGLGHEDWRYA
ncbi:MAG: DUF1295 domain-containing protein, partial [Clostridia bacterium]|nr:DUF1295 domain-containing protein [Clostridia bacterium]